MSYGPEQVKDRFRKVWICCLCGDAIQPDLFGWEQGHNAQPVEDGRCCTICNDTVVIPLRISLLQRRAKSKATGK